MRVLTFFCTPLPQTDLANKYFECLTECIENLREQLDAFQKVCAFGVAIEEFALNALDIVQMRVAHQQYKRHMERTCCGGARLGPVEMLRR